MELYKKEKIIRKLTGGRISYPDECKSCSDFGYFNYNKNKYVCVNLAYGKGHSYCKVCEEITRGRRN